MLSQLIVLFGFFALVLVSVFWINGAVRLFDRLIGDGQSAMIFLEFSALTLPNVIRTILPIAAFAAAVYVTNRLSTESELVVMQATGFSPWRLARPVLVFGLIVGAMMTIMTHLLVPVSRGELRAREMALAENVTAQLLVEGTFIHPSSGVTFYIRQIDPDGTLHDMFLSDRSDPLEPQTFTAETAYLVNGADEEAGEPPAPKLVMIDGLSQTYRTESQQLFTTHFKDFAYDISKVIGSGTVHGIDIRNLFTPELLFRTAAVQEMTGESLGRIMDELHGRFQQALMCVVSALVGFAALLSGGYSRFGVWRHVVAAVLLIVLLRVLESLVVDPVREDGALWPLVYVPTVAGLAISAWLLWWSGRTRRVAAPQEAMPA